MVRVETLSSWTCFASQTAICPHHSRSSNEGLEHRGRTRDPDVEQRVQAAGAHEGRVEEVRPVGGADHKHVAGAGACRAAAHEVNRRGEWARMIMEVGWFTRSHAVGRALFPLDQSKASKLLT